LRIAVIAFPFAALEFTGGTFMAIGWLTVLQNVPWTEVINNAPKVADGARKLWNAVGKRAPAADTSDQAAQPGVSPEAERIATLEARAAELEAAVADLHGQMLASSELIKALADQNAQLIRHIETNRVRVLWLSAGTAVTAIVALAGLFLAYSQHGI
jgi:hypothetical protein